MLTIANTEFKVVEFLVRNIHQKFTIRSISQQLKLSPAGVHKTLKKLEQDNIVLSEKLGTGLFYEINLHNNVAKNLAAFVLSYSSKPVPKELEDVKEIAKSAIILNNNVLILADESDKPEIESKFSSITETKYNPIIMSKQEFAEKVKKKDKTVTDIMKTGAILFGEHLLLESLKVLL